jgi:hypothetical protein
MMVVHVILFLMGNHGAMRIFLAYGGGDEGEYLDLF